ncbi:autotransporter outer membrane beta-barrel domain-containing protein [Pseudomonas syringae]|uniref:autotransporter outer membrane beta-barrel domain-containing protein n=1 Tax=Pseudomonas syringae TaxID=317 RepID=UPI001F3EBE73|nr:autotransporter outer membrane beta-barrel domain-containing protein [Pseudomonas syringae]MBL3830875.1 autotransporter outer membrane beta-barrel domain-containing protein [Pseudomonas syringae pv. theae]MBL3834219.1 autotransporter outer membrane beta-barrel domain-containing protein [Pseudomonas syringae pv. theae]MBL3866195.1 autotransporter outer membrane beta-barrel domain-containing protein [Pseudomonas syringae pv. theae]
MVSWRESNVRNFRSCILQFSVLAAGALIAGQASADRQRSTDTGYQTFGKVAIPLPDEEVLVNLPVSGDVVTVGPDAAFDSYFVSNKSVLNINSGRVDKVYATHSTVNIESGVVENGLHLSDSVANLDHATVRNNSGSGISLAGIRKSEQPGSHASIFSSSVSGLEVGIAVGLWGELHLVNTDLHGFASPRGRGQGILSSGGKVFINERSHVIGDLNGLNITDGSATKDSDGSLIGNKSYTVINDSVVEGLTGAAIRVDHRVLFDIEADIAVQNHSELLSGNGNLLEVADSSTVNFNVDNSTLNGNLVADDTSTLNVTLQNGAQLNGDIINGNTLAITSGGQWQMQGDNAVKSLSMQGGSVGFGGEGFHTLSLNELSGSGTFGMRVDLDNGVGDLINVNGQASGQFGLRVRNTGVEVISDDMQPLKVVHTEGGDAQFSLLGGRVDLGAYSYLLEQQGNDWFVVGGDKVISPSTQSALALYSAAPAIWMSELSTLRSRMGEVRASGQAGGWMRAYGSRLNATTSDGVDYRQKQSGLSLGADAPVEVSNGRLLVGVLGGYSTSDLDLSRGTTGKVASYYAGAYGTWLSDDGYYVDGVLKLNRFRNKADVAMSDASKAKGDYGNTGVGGWVEVGRHIKLADDYFLEPFAQLSSVVVQGQELRLDNGMKAKNARTQSVLGKVGTSLGRTVALKDGGVLQPYVRVAVAQEFSRRNEVKANDVKFDNSLFGSRGELGAGVSVSLSERLKLHADVDYMKGQHIEQPWGANVGLRLTF